MACHNNGESFELLGDRPEFLVNGKNRVGYGTAGSTGCHEDRSIRENQKEAAKSCDKDNHSHKWLLPFFINIFLACASFSIVMPSLAPYLLQIRAPLSFLPWVVSSYSLGEMIGSASIGLFYEYATNTFKVEGRGPRLSLLLCYCLGIFGSLMYAAAGWIANDTLAQYFILIGRFIQGIWTGGQQAVEQAYLSAAVHPSTRVEYTATLSTCAVVGFVMGPSIGAAFSQINTIIFGLSINANNAPGVFILFSISIMFIQTAVFFDGKDDRTGSSLSSVSDDFSCEIKTRRSDHKKPFNTTGVVMSIVIFLVHYYSFAVQETITTPMVIALYHWSSVEINLLFVVAGMISLITSFTVRSITRHVKDQNMLISSIVIGLIGSALLMDSPFNKVLPPWRFLSGFSLITMAFPVGRTVVLGMFGNILGPVNQGRWMGVIIAVSTLPRVLGPFLALKSLEFIHWRTWLAFGLCALFFTLTLIGAIQTLDSLVPYSDFLKATDDESTGIVNSIIPIPSPILIRNNSMSKKQKESYQSD